MQELTVQAVDLPVYYVLKGNTSQYQGPPYVKIVLQIRSHQKAVFLKQIVYVSLDTRDLQMDHVLYVKFDPIQKELAK